jgi:hypothetical protein
MSLMPDNAERADAVGDIYQECVQELQQPYPDYAKVQALATLSLVETAREVARQVTELNHQLTSRQGSDP